MGEAELLEFAVQTARNEDVWEIVRFLVRVGGVGFVLLVAARVFWQVVTLTWLWLWVRLFGYVRRYDVVELYGTEMKLVAVRLRGCIFETPKVDRIKIIPLDTWIRTEKILITQKPQANRRVTGR